MRISKYIILLLPLLATCFSARGQYAERIIVPGVITAVGAMIHFTAHDAIDVPVNNVTAGWRGNAQTVNFDSYLRFLPVAADIGLGLIGVDAKRGFFDRGVEAAWTYGSLIGISFIIKQCVSSPRPDGTDNRSFPSGHAGIAFAGAELVRMEYGWAWGAGAYAVATGVCAARLYNNSHWISDIIMGAGLGILCAELSSYLVEPTKRILGLNKYEFKLTAAPCTDPVSGTLGCSLALVF